MLLRDMQQTNLDLGEHKRGDGETFTVKAVLYICPMEYNYWLAIYDVMHPKWKRMAFKAVIPKRIAATDLVARQYVQGPIAEQVQSIIGRATSSGRNLEVAFSDDGWSLV